MSEQAILHWMARIDERLDSLQASVAELQGRYRADVAVRRVQGRGKGILIKSAAALMAAAAGAITAHFLGQ